MIIITSRVADIRPLSSTMSVRPMKSLSLKMKETLTVSGQRFCLGHHGADIFHVSRTLAPERLDTSRE